MYNDVIPSSLLISLNDTIASSLLSNFFLNNLEGEMTHPGFIENHNQIMS